MTTRDEDILDFDFFGDEEPPTWDDPEEREPGASTRPRPSPPAAVPASAVPGNLTPLLRLVGLIALAILIVVLLGVWVDGCASDRKTERYRNYMTDVGAIGNASARLGQELTTYLTTPALKLEDLDAKLGGYVQTAETHLQSAEDLGSPGPLHDSHDGAIESLQFRVNGIRGLRTAFQQTADAQEASEAGEQLSQQAGAPGRERRHLVGLLQGLRGRRARVRGSRARGAVVGVHHRRRAHDPGGVRADLDAHPGRGQRRHGDRASTGTGSRT